MDTKSEQTVPVGIFWDIENCPVPKQKSAGDVIDEIRKKFISERPNHSEFEFLIGCTASNTHLVDKSRLMVNLPPETAREIDKKYGVFLVQVLKKKDAVDNKLIEGILKFVDTTKLVTNIRPVVVVASGDQDFGKIIFSLQRRGCDCILLYNDQCRVDMKSICTEVHAFQAFCAALPQKIKDESTKQKKGNQSNGVGGDGGSPAASGGQKINQAKHQADSKPTEIEHTKATPTKVAAALAAQKVSPALSANNSSQVLGHGVSYCEASIQLIVMGFSGKTPEALLSKKLETSVIPFDGNLMQVKNGQALINFQSAAQAEKAREFFAKTDTFGGPLKPSFTRNRNAGLRQVIPE